MLKNYSNEVAHVTVIYVTMTLPRAYISNVFCTQVHVGGRSKGGLYETVFDLANNSNLSQKLMEYIATEYGSMEYAYVGDSLEKLKETLWTEPDMTIIRYKGEKVTIGHAALMKGTISGYVDVGVSDIKVNIVVKDGKPIGEITIRRIRVNIKGDLVLN